MKISSDHNFIMDMKNKIVPINKTGKFIDPSYYRGIHLYKPEE